MKRLLPIGLVFQFLFLAGAYGAPPADSGEEEVHRAVEAKLRIEHNYLTKFLGLKQEFNLDHEHNLKLLYQRFPKETSTTAIEAALRAAGIQDKNIRTKLSSKADSLQAAVRFLTESPIRRETRYTFTFKQNVQGNLIETYYLTEHFSGGWSGPKDDNAPERKR